jgi:adenosylcobinamide-phosphate synthase
VKCMRQYTTPIANALEKDNVDEAKRLLPYIVRRDPATLSKRHVVSAAVESIAESITDGVTSPFFYFALFGVPGAFVYRVINTLDSMVGYKDEAHGNIGWFSANLDTVANYVPSRLTAMLMVVSAMLLGENWRGSWRIIRRDRRCMTSVNAGWTIAAMAGALSTQLEKPGFYKLGDEDGLEPAHIKRALRMMSVTVVLFSAAVVVPILFLKEIILSKLAIEWLFERKGGIRIS